MTVLITQKVKTTWHYEVKDTLLNLDFNVFSPLRGANSKLINWQPRSYPSFWSTVPHQSVRSNEKFQNTQGSKQETQYKKEILWQKGKEQQCHSDNTRGKNKEWHGSRGLSTLVLNLNHCFSHKGSRGTKVTRNSERIGRWSQVWNSYVGR